MPGVSAGPGGSGLNPGSLRPRWGSRWPALGGCLLGGRGGARSPSGGTVLGQQLGRRALFWGQGEEARRLCSQQFCLCPLPLLGGLRTRASARNDLSHRALFSAETRVSPLQGGYGGRPCESGRVGPDLGAVASGALGARLITAPPHQARGGHVGVRATSAQLPRTDWSRPLTLHGCGGGGPGRDAAGSLLGASGQGRGARPCGLERAPWASASELVRAGGSVGPPTTAGQPAGGLWSSLCVSSGRFVGGPWQGLGGLASCPAGEPKVRKGSQAEEGRSHKSGGKKRHTSFPSVTSGQTASPPSWRAAQAVVPSLLPCLPGSHSLRTSHSANSERGAGALLRARGPAHPAAPVCATQARGPSRERWCPAGVGPPDFCPLPSGNPLPPLSLPRFP